MITTAPQPTSELQPNDLLNPSKIDKLDNDSICILALGEEREVRIRGREAGNVRVMNLSGDLQDSDRPMPEIHVITPGLDHLVQAITPGDKGSTLASYIPEEHLIRITLPNQSGSAVPSKIELTGRDLKVIMAALHHELAHAAGKEEYYAYLRQYQTEHQLGLRERVPSGADIMEEIREGYRQADFAVALDEFNEHNSIKAQEYMLRLEAVLPEFYQAVVE